VTRQRILIITYYWPPSGGSGVQRWLKFARYLPGHGIDPVIYTPANPEADVFDESLLKDVPGGIRVVKQPIREPGQLIGAFRKLFGQKKASSGASRPGGMMSWIRGNLFIPDPRVGWVKPSVKFLEDFLQREPIDIVITTGPPHSMHLIGLQLKRQIPSLKWIADFRDPWTTWGALEKFRLGDRARRRHLELEREVVMTADEVVTISPFYVKQFSERFGRNITLLTNGYDEEDFRGFQVQHTSDFILRHVGIVHPELRLDPFFRVFRDWAANKPEVRLVFTGRVPDDVWQSVESDSLLRERIVFESSVPHTELLLKYAHSSALLLLLNGYRDAEGFLPGKLFEYLATGLPVVSSGPPAGDASALLTACGHSPLCAADDEAGMRLQLEQAYAAWKSGEAIHSLSDASSVWTRQEVTRKLADWLAQ